MKYIVKTKILIYIFWFFISADIFAGNSVCKGDNFNPVIPVAINCSLYPKEYIPDVVIKKYLNNLRVGSWPGDSESKWLIYAKYADKKSGIVYFVSAGPQKVGENFEGIEWLNYWVFSLNKKENYSLVGSFSMIDYSLKKYHSDKFIDLGKSVVDGLFDDAVNRLIGAVGRRALYKAIVIDGYRYNVGQFSLALVDALRRNGINVPNKFIRISNPNLP